MEINTRCPHCQGDILITIGKYDKAPAPSPQAPIYEDVKCPECGGPMKSRTGQYGTFWGCMKYPDCRGTRDSEGLSKDERAAKRAAEPEKPERGFSFNRASRVDKIE